MKQICSVILLMFVFVVFTNAQTTPKRISLNDQSIVKDSSGMIFPYAIWQKLTQSGDYGVKLLNGESDPPEFLLVRLSEAEKQARMDRAPKPNESKFFKTGQTISNQKMVSMDGKRYSLKDLKGKVVVFNFWFINCSPCRLEIPHLNNIVESYKGREDVIFLAVALDEAYDLKNFLKDMPFNYKIIDGGRYIASDYGITLYPTHLVLDKEGKVVFHTSGYGSGTIPWLRKSIDASLKSEILP